VESPTSSKDEIEEEEPATYQQQHQQQQQQQHIPSSHHRLRRLLQSTTARGTPVYWSASQLLSKLEEDGGGSSPASSATPPHHSAYAMQNEVYNSYHGLTATRGGGHHVLPLEETSCRQSSLPHPRHSGGTIPEEFCVTVSNLQQQLPRYGSDTDSGIEQTVVSLSDELPRLHSANLHRSSYRERLPPPLYPKPKNITQV
jgi:hypothetical protein